MKYSNSMFIMLFPFHIFLSTTLPRRYFLPAMPLIIIFWLTIETVSENE